MELVGMGILKPVVVLAAWTMAMWVWMYATRIPAMRAAKTDLDKLANEPGASLDAILPPQIQWKAKNYNHLHEAPTVFYAIALVLAMIGQGDGLNENLGWAYVALRVIHSLVQAIGNKIMLRFSVFAASSLVLVALIVHAALALFY
jgi:hypothetical protein